VDILERVGSYAGLAAFLGLAILALLYFSQARDVRRLRDWAGRAPERSSGEAATQHYFPPATIEESGQRKRRPIRERLRRIHIPQFRYLALAVAGILVLTGATYGVLQLVSDNEPAGSSSTAGRARQARSSDGQRGAARRPRVNVNPADVTVAVLNGTQIAGLAAQVAEEARADGFTLGTVTNAARTNQTRSEVLYRDGQRDAAAAVSDRLGIHSTGQVDPLTSELAGSFDVVVLVGSDRSG
jgi:hypothetical protein